MNKKELIQKISDEQLIVEKTVKKIVDAVFETIQAQLSAGEKVELKNFGLFDVKDVAERKGRNPRTGEEIIIPAHKLPFFKAGSILKKAVNNDG